MIHLPIFFLMNPPKANGNQYTQTAATPQAPAVTAVNSTPAPWSTGLCNCWDDFGTCLITCLCPCITFGRIAEIVDKGTTPCEVSAVLYAMICCVMGCHWIYSCTYRSKMRESFFLEKGPCPDCLVHLCCDTCALSQEYRELKNRGFDLDLGWKANLYRQSAVMLAPPVIQGGMGRENIVPSKVQ